MSKKKLFINIICIFIVALVLSCNIFSAVAENENTEISSEVQKTIELIDNLPKNPESVVENDKGKISDAKSAYNSLSADQKLQLPTEKLQILNNDYNALLPFILKNVVSGVKALPKLSKLKSSDRDNVISLYEDYCLLDDSCKSAFSKEHYDTLIKALEKLAPDKLPDDSKENDNKPVENNNNKTNDQVTDNNQNLQQVWQLVLIIFISAIVLCALTAMIILIVKIIRLGKQK